MNERAPHNPSVVGSRPTRPTCGFGVSLRCPVDRRGCNCVACRVSLSGHIEQLPSGSWRAKVYA